MRVLFIEGDSQTAEDINLMLKTEGFNVYTTSSGDDGVDLGKNYDYDIILLDLKLPDMSGYQALRSLRSARIASPILVISALFGIEVKLNALRLGADDYLTRPFDKSEFVARIRAIVRRSKGHAQSRITTGDLVIDLDAQKAELCGAPLPLTPREYQILELLALRKGSATTRTMIMNNLYGGLVEPEVKIIDVFICKLRRKIADASNGSNYIENIWGVGYALRQPVEQLLAS